jgi:hypothetical protein
MNQITDEVYNQFLVDNKLNFNVAMMPQTITVPCLCDDGTLHPTLTKTIPTKGFCPVRTDTMQPLSRGGCAHSFTPIQNRDAFRVLQEMGNVADISLVSGKISRNGAIVYGQVTLGDIDLGGGDKVGKYLSIYNSHDGSKAMRVLFTPRRYFCMNQITASINEATEAEMVCIHHDSRAHDRLAELVHTVNLAKGVFEETAQVYSHLKNTPITADYVDECIRRLFPAVEDKGQKPGAFKAANTKREAKINKFAARFQSADGGRVQRDTAWNLYNAFQGTFQHDLFPNADISSILHGTIAEQSALALAVVSEVCSSQHIPSSVLSEIDQLTA